MMPRIHNFVVGKWITANTVWRLCTRFIVLDLPNVPSSRTIPLVIDPGMTMKKKKLASFAVSKIR